MVAGGRELLRPFGGVRAYRRLHYQLHWRQVRRNGLDTELARLVDMGMGKLLMLPLLQV
jgi:hypothetical protein